MSPPCLVSDQFITSQVGDTDKNRWFWEHGAKLPKATDCCSPWVLPSHHFALWRAQNQRAASCMPLPGSCALGCWTIECLKLLLLLEAYRWVYQIMLRDVICQSFGTSARKAFHQWMFRKTLVIFLFCFVFLGCFSELGRSFNDLHASPRREWNWLRLTLRCCLLPKPHFSGPEEKVLTHNSAWQPLLSWDY